MKYALIVIFALHPFVGYIFLGQACSNMAFCGILFTIIAFMFFLKGDKENIKLPLNCFWLWALVYTLFLQFTQVPDEKVHIGFNSVTHFSVFFLFYYSLSVSDFDWKEIIKPLGYVCIAVSLLSISEILGMRNYKYNWWPHPGPLGNPTDTAMYIAMTSPFLIVHKRGYLWMIIPITAIAMLGSASAMLGIIGVIIVYLIIKEYFLRLTLLVTAISYGIYFWFDKILEFFNPMAKITVWMQAMTDWKEFAWFGGGFGSFLGKYKVDNVARLMHNHFFYILYVLGFVGLLALLVWLGPILKNGWKYRSGYILPLCSVTAVLIMSNCSVPMRVYPIALITAFNLAVITKEAEDG